MNLDRVSPGRRAPEEVNVIVEIPLRGEPVKYEVDKETGAMFVDRFLNTAMHYPCNYGYVPHTLAEDGDPVDVLVITPVPIISGAVVRCRPVGLLRMEDEKGRDDKVLAVPVNELCGLYDDVQSPPRSAAHGAGAGRTFLRALQGSGSGEVGESAGMGRRRRGRGGDREVHRALPAGPGETGILKRIGEAYRHG